MTTLAEIKAAAETGLPLPVEGKRNHPCQLMGAGTWSDRDKSDCPHYELVAAHRDWLVKRCEELAEALRWVQANCAEPDAQAIADDALAALSRLEGET